MAFNWQTFRTRTLTAAVFVAVMLTGLLWNQWSFFLLFSVIHFGCWMEYQKMVGLIDPGYQAITPFHKYGVMIAGWCILLYFTGDDFTLFGLSLHELGWWLGLIFVFALPVIEILFAKQVVPKNTGHSFFGLIYISLSLGLMMNLFEFKRDVMISDTGFVLAEGFIPIVIIGSIWINDTMAYIVGSLIGKTPLSKISPKKTWEGTIGGILLSVGLTGILFSLIYNRAVIAGFVLLLMPLSLISAIAGTFGDLLESKLKRMAGVKDSGHIMPGHGGFLDRFDSLLLAIPFVWLYVYFFLRK